MNQTSNYKLTIISPIFNEEGNINRLSETLSEYIKSTTNNSICVLFVNDCSSDNSLHLIKNECNKNNNFFYISLEKRCGLSGAIKAGFENTFSPLVGYIDADLQTTPKDFDLLIPYTNDYPLVLGIRANRKDSKWKNFQSKFANGFRKMFTHDGATDTGCPLKIMHTSYAKRIPLFTGMHRFFPALILLQEGGKFKEVPVRHFPRIAGVSKYNFMNRFFGPLKDCFVYRWMKKRYINYSIKESNIND